MPSHLAVDYAFCDILDWKYMDLNPGTGAGVQKLDPSEAYFIYLFTRGDMNILVLRNTFRVLGVFYF
jgi:hypothetical protein